MDGHAGSLGRRRGRTSGARHKTADAGWRPPGQADVIWRIASHLEYAGQSLAPLTGCPVAGSGDLVTSPHTPRRARHRQAGFNDKLSSGSTLLPCSGRPAGAPCLTSPKPADQRIRCPAEFDHMQPDAAGCPCLSEFPEYTRNESWASAQVGRRIMSSPERAGVGLDRGQAGPHESGRRDQRGEDARSVCRGELAWPRADDVPVRRE
jgi:hypothetical protein